MVELKGISWAGIPVDDFDGAVGYFQDQLGLPLTLLDEERDVAHFPLTNGDLVELFGPNNPREEHRRNLAIAFQVDDVEAARNELEGRGVRFVTETRSSDGESWCYFEGPDRLLFEIHSTSRRD